MKKLVFLLFFSLVIPTACLKAQSVDILWQGEGYAAPFYQGRALWSKQARVTFVAVPQGLGNPATLDYIWSKNGTILGNSSGIGKNSLSFTDTLFSKPVTVKVEIVRGDEELLADASVTLTPVSPFAIIYEENPLYGIMFHREVSGTYTMEKSEVTFTGFPFLFNARRRDDGTLTYKWGGATGESVITYRAPEEGEGTSLVSLNVSHQEDFMQNAVKSFLVEFGDDNE